ncbi:unnamed protein product [Kuraishia capsulata CBS 1993]|uniref:HORMA domain-containing protein n=1 Tax=Kuraishia capsulata CBS 1993 TaxID=1382522 RepID=W6MG31_9ASCO|nr:uncharacterized protein KUCA_T00000632001 [Kuraishia capsulata CBS 1993]CDK24666.1 unnamed protein product [Kuraishia capsulata CBS 1993]
MRNVEHIAYKNITAQQSEKLVQSTLLVSLGCIAYLRGLFNEKAFEDRPLRPIGGQDFENNKRFIPTKVLVRGINEDIDLLLDWLEIGVFDAINKRFLRCLAITICSNQQKLEELSETYLFSFDYSVDKNVAMNISTTDRVSSEYPALDVTKQEGLELIKRLILSTQELPEPPKHKSLSMRLLFNESCPPRYQPRFFMDASENPPATIKLKTSNAAKSNSIGNIKAKFHNFEAWILHSVGIDDARSGQASNVNIFDFIDSNILKRKPQTQMPVTPEEDYNLPNSNNLKRVNLGKNVGTFFINSSVVYTQEVSKSKTATPGPRCECGSRVSLLYSKEFQCSRCQKAVHSVCYLESGIPCVCFSCRAIETGGKVHNELPILMNIRKTYSYLKIAIPQSLEVLIEALGYDINNESVDLVTKVLTVMAFDRLVLITQTPFMLQKSEKMINACFMFEVQWDGILLDNKPLPKGTYAMTFMPFAQGVKACEEYLSRYRDRKKYYFEETVGFGVMTNDPNTPASLSCSEVEIRSSSLVDTFDKDPIESPDFITHAEGGCSEDEIEVEVSLSNEPDLKKARKVSVTKAVLRNI